jgi:peptidylprolyl isomerase
MKVLVVVLAVVSMLGSAFPGCDQDQTANREGAPAPNVVTYPTDPSGRFGTITYKGHRADPEIHPSDEPPVNRLLVRDLKIGKGPKVHPGDRVALYYLGVDHETGETSYRRWPPEPQLARSLEGDPWEEALVGMREGGRREIVIPPRLHFSSSTIDYLFEMVKVGEPSRNGG